MQGASIVCEDGTRGAVVAEKGPGLLVVELQDGSRFVVAADTLVAQTDGSYRLPLSAAHLAEAAGSDEVIIPVIAEELTVETQRVARARVRVVKRIQTREEVVDAPVTVEEVVVEHTPVNRLIEDPDAVPTVREEAGVLVIPVIEEVLVVQKQLLVREEVRMFKRRTTTTSQQTVVLRREVVDVQREDLSAAELPGREGPSPAAKEGRP